MLEVVGAHRVRVQVDAPQVYDPQQLRRVAHDDLSRGPARGKAELHRLDPLGMDLGCPFLEEWLVICAVYIALEHDRPPSNPSQRRLGDRRIVPGQVELRVAGLLEEHLVRVGYYHFAAGGFQDGQLRLPHENSVARFTFGAQVLWHRDRGGCRCARNAPPGLFPGAARGRPRRCESTVSHSSDIRLSSVIFSRVIPDRIWSLCLWAIRATLSVWRTAAAAVVIASKHAPFLSVQSPWRQSSGHGLTGISESPGWLPTLA